MSQTGCAHHGRPPASAALHAAARSPSDPQSQPPAADDRPCLPQLCSLVPGAAIAASTASTADTADTADTATDARTLCDLDRPVRDVSTRPFPPADLASRTAAQPWRLGGRAGTQREEP